MPAQGSRTRYESLPKAPGVTRVHARACARLEGRRCNCQPGYRAEVHDAETGKRAYRTFPALEPARRWRTDRRTALHNGQRVTAKVTVADAWAEMYAGILAGTIKAAGGAPYKPGVVRLYESKFRNQLLPRFGSRSVSDVRLVHVQGLIDDLVAGGAAARTVRNAIVPLRAFYRWCIRKEYATLNPCDNAEL